MSNLKQELLNQAQNSAEIFELESGSQVELRLPSVNSNISSMTSLANKRESMSEEELFREFIVQQLIHSVYNPETGERVFDDEDTDALMDAPANSVINDMMLRLMEVMGMNRAGG